MDVHLKDYLGIMEQDARMRYADDHDASILPDDIKIDERAKSDAAAVVKAFYEAFPDSTADGGEVYLERIYGDEVSMSKEEREWILKEFPTDATATIDESVDGDLRIFFE